MNKVDKATLIDIANKLMFDMEEEQYDTLLVEFDSILKQMDFIVDIPGVDDVEPMTFPFDSFTSYLREDVASTPLTNEESLRNAKNASNGQITLPRVVRK